MRLAFLFVISLGVLLTNTIITAPIVHAEAAQLKTVKLDVDKMTCRLRPFTVNKALRKVDGVVKAKSKYEGNGVGWAVVTYDASKTNAEELTRATTQAGYPSKLIAIP